MWSRSLLSLAAALAALTLAATTACGSKTPPRRPGEEYLKAIEVEGNANFKDKKLTRGLALKRTLSRGRAPDPYLVQVDGDRIEGAYLRRGYLAADVQSRIDRDGNASTVVYTVLEGKRAITRVTITGLPEADPDLTYQKARAALPLKEGAAFDYETYELNKELMLGVAKDAGYAHAKLDSRIYADRANHIAVVQLDYTLGPKCKFGTVSIAGAEGDLADAIRGRLQFKAGDTYSSAALAATQRQLYAFSRFSTVQVQTADDSTMNPTVNVKVAVSEAARREIKLGGGFGIDPTAYEIRGRAGYSIAGWPRPLQTVIVDLRPAYAYLRNGSGFQPRVRALVRLEHQDLLWTYSKGEIEPAYQYTALEAYTVTGPRLRLGFTTPVFTQRVNARVGWSLERVSFLNISPALDPLLQEEIGLGMDPQLVGSFQQSISLDLRDNPISTTEGLYADFRILEGTRFAGGEFEYIQVVPDVRGYVSIGNVVLAARGRVGAFFGDAPPTERFFSGGASNHRGFGERQLSPSATGLLVADDPGSTGTVPYGGKAMLETSIEARIPLTTFREIGIGMVTFLDGGDNTEALADIDVANLHWAAGLGLRLNTIVGPIRADLGYRLNRTSEMDPAPGSRFAFHLSLGEAF